MSAMIDNEASFEGIFDDQQFEQEEQAGHTEQQGADDLFSDAEGSVASEAVMPMVNLCQVCEEGAQLLTRIVWALLTAFKQLKTGLRRLGRKLHNPTISCKNP
jgi:hypothetical protein